MPTSKPGRNAQGHGPNQPRHQFKEGKDGEPAGVFDGSRDRNNNADHPPGMEAGPLKDNGVNKHGGPRLDHTKQKADFDDHE